jgi:hypothetical protein
MARAAKVKNPEDDLLKAKPKKAGEMADLLYNIREARHALGRRAALLEKREKELKDLVRQEALKQKGAGVVGKIAVVTIEMNTVPIVTDWPTLHKYMKKNDAFDLMQRRLSKEAVEERWNAGKVIDGIKSEQFANVHINKLGGKT